MRAKILLSICVFASPLLVFGGQSEKPSLADQRLANRAHVTENPAKQTAPRDSYQITCVGNFGERYNVTVPARRFIVLSAPDQAYVGEDSQRPLTSSGCGYNTVAPLPDTSAFRK